MKKARTKCYIYTRVSTAMQVDGYSLDAQREKLRKYADYEDMVIAGEYSDEGFSGKNIQGRHEFQQMLRDVQDCKDGVSYVLVFKLSRFGRTMPFAPSLTSNKASSEVAFLKSELCENIRLVICSVVESERLEDAISTALTPIVLTGSFCP